MFTQIRDNLLSILAIIALMWGAFIYINDIRYMVGNIAVRNIAWAVNQICTVDDSETRWEYLYDELDRYERYLNREHRYRGMSKDELCDSENR